MATCSQLPTKLFANARRRAGNKCSSHEISLRGKAHQRQGRSPQLPQGPKELANRSLVNERGSIREQADSIPEQAGLIREQAGSEPAD